MALSVSDLAYDIYILSYLVKFNFCNHIK